MDSVISASPSGELSISSRMVDSVSVCANNSDDQNKIASKYQFQEAVGAVNEVAARGLVQHGVGDQSVDAHIGMPLALPSAHCVWPGFDATHNVYSFGLSARQYR